MGKTPKQLLLEISSFGLSDSEIAKRVFSTQPTISRIKSESVRDCRSALLRNIEKLLSELSKAGE